MNDEFIHSISENVLNSMLKWIYQVIFYLWPVWNGLLDRLDSLLHARQHFLRSGIQRLQNNYVLELEWSCFKCLMRKLRTCCCANKSFFCFWIKLRLLPANGCTMHIIIQYIRKPKYLSNMFLICFWIFSSATSDHFPQSFRSWDDLTLLWIFGRLFFEVFSIQFCYWSYNPFSCSNNSSKLASLQIFLICASFFLSL